MTKFEGVCVGGPHDGKAMTSTAAMVRIPLPDPDPRKMPTAPLVRVPTVEYHWHDDGTWRLQPAALPKDYRIHA